MVRVISAHHFAAQDVSCCSAPCSSAVAGDLLLVASHLHQVEVRNLKVSPATSHTFPTVDLVERMEYSPVGRYLATVERRAQVNFVRVYINWWSSEAAAQPMRARVPGLTPSHQEELSLEMIEVGVKDPITGLAVCPSTGNLVVVTGHTLLVYKLCVVNTTKSKYTDFQECLNITLSFPPSEVQLVEDTIACLHPSQLHVFKVGLVEEGDERGMRSLSSSYSFSSESECSLETKDETKGGGAGGGGAVTAGGGKTGTVGGGQGSGAGGGGGAILRNPQLSNVTARRRTDSSSEREVLTEESMGPGIRKHPGHVTIGGGSSESEDEEEEGKERERMSGVERIQPDLVQREEREIGSLTTPRLLEQVLGPMPTTDITVTLVGPWGEAVGAEAISLVKAVMPEQERRHERLHLLRLDPVYWRQWRVKRGRGSTGTPHLPHSPLISIWHSHLMSISLVMASVHEGYLYHVPGHLRRPGRGVGVQRIATYPFTSPVLDLALEPSVLHALTETGLETYTLRAGYHTVREAEQVDGKTNALPPPSTPICLIGLRPFLGVDSLLLATSHLVLLSQPSSEDEDWTVYSLHLPSHTALYQDMLAVADMNAGAPHGFLQLVSEAHVVARTWMHRLSWLQVIKPHGVEVTAEDVEAARTNFQESCLRLASHYVECQTRNQHSLALPYFSMSGLPQIKVLERLPLSTPLAPGVVLYIEELVLTSSTANQDNFLEAEVVDKVISILGRHSIKDLVRLVLASPALRQFKTRQSLDLLEQDLRQKADIDADQAVATVLVGGSGTWLALAPPVQLSNTLLSHYFLLFEPGPQGSSQHSFSSFGTEVRTHVPVIFVEVCVSLIQSGLATLGQLLNLLLQSFMAVVTSSQSSVESAGILQLFLETYFMELVGEGNTKHLDPDQQQALLTLLRSYLGALVHPLPGPQLEDCILPTGPGNTFGPRLEYLDLITSDCASSTLLRLQSLLSSSYCDQNCRDTVAKYVEEHPCLEDQLSLQLLSLPPGREGALVLCREGRAGVLGNYCSSVAGDRTQVWGECLQVLLEQQPSQDRQDSLESLLVTMAASLPPSTLGPLLPPGDQFQPYLAESRSHQQAARLQEMIVQTGGKLLETLAL